MHIPLSHKQYKFIEINLIFLLSFWTLFRERKQVQVAIESGVLFGSSQVYSPFIISTELALAPPTTLHFFSSVLISLLNNVALASSIVLLISLVAYFYGMHLLATSFGLPKIISFSILFFISIFNDFLEDYMVNMYPFEFDSVNSWGQFGVSFSILLIGLVSKQKFKLLFISAILLIAFQILWGVWTIGLILLTISIIFHNKILKYFKVKKYRYSIAVSILVMATVISTLIYRLMNFKFDTANLFTYYKVWDYHRSQSLDQESITNSLILLFALLLLYLISIYKNFDIKFVTLFFSLSIIFSILLYLLQNYSDFFYNQLITFMVGRFFNLHASVVVIVLTALLYLIIFSILNRFNKIHANLGKLLSYTSTISLIFILYFNNSYLIAPKSIQDLKDNVYNNALKSPAKYCENLVAGNILAIGKIAKSMISDCRVAPMLDTNQTDTVTGSEVLATKVKLYTEELYGINFQNPEFTAENFGLNFTPAGDIPQELTERIWGLRTEQEWNHLICKYDINQIIVSKDSYLIFSEYIKSNGYRFYDVKCPQNNDSELPNMRFFSKIPIQYYKSGKYYFWVTGDNNQISLQNLQSNLLKGELKFRATPNPCKITNKINVIQTDFNQTLYDLEIKNNPSYFSFPLTIQPDQKITLEFARESGQICTVDGDIRDFVFEISEIEFIDK